MAVITLGINAAFHDSAAALVVDGVVVAAAEEERFTRRKHDPEFPTNAIRYVMAEAGIDTSDLGHVVFFEKPFLKFERILSTALGTFPRGARVFQNAMTTWLVDKLWIAGRIVRPSRLKED